MTSKTDFADVLLCSLWARVAIAAGMNDKDAALEIVRDLHLAEGKLFITTTSPNTELGAERAREPEFSGRPMISRFPGRCAVCRAGFPAGVEILYSAERRAAAHVRCGEVA